MGINFPNPLKSIFANLRRTDSALDGPAFVVYNAFEVRDPDLAKALNKWIYADTVHRETLNGFVRNIFTEAYYRVDEAGKLEEVLYHGQMLSIPKGWKRNQGSHWMVPADAETQAMVDALPCLPSRKQLHDLIGWPTFNIPRGVDEEIRSFVEWRNRLVHPKAPGFGTYILVADPESLKDDCPDLYPDIAGWKRPDGLFPVPLEEVKKIEGLCNNLRRGNVLPVLKQELA